MDKPRALGDGNLVKRLRSKHTIDPPLRQVIRHIGRRHLYDGDLPERVHAMLSQIVAKQVIVHGKAIGHTKSKSPHARHPANAKMFFG